MTSAAMKSQDSQTDSATAEVVQTRSVRPVTSPDRTWVRTSPLITAVCSTSIMGAAFAVPLATMSAPEELRGVVLSMSLGVFSTVMAIAAGAALTTQSRRR